VDDGEIFTLAQLKAWSLNRLIRVGVFASVIRVTFIVNDVSRD